MDFLRWSRLSPVTDLIFFSFSLELVSNHLNGTRTLSNDQLSCLVISQYDPTIPEFHLFMCAPHFMGDGIPVHQSTHDLLVILASFKSDSELKQDLEDLLECNSSRWSTLLPPAFESLLKTPTSPLARAICKVNFLQAQQHEIGNHVLPRQQRGAKRTWFLEHTFSEDQTRAILSICKSRGVSVNNAIFALCASAWAKTRCGVDVDGNVMPVMMYSAINLRPFLQSTLSYWYLSITYFTVTLPSYAPKSAATFWNRARLAKKQTSRAVKSPFLLARALEMSIQRAAASGPQAIIKPQLPPHARVDPAAPSRALLGLSLLGNLDMIYVREKYERSGVELISVTGAARQKEGGILFLVHTFGGRLWLQLCWDEAGFAEGVIEQWWKSVVSDVGEYML